MAGFEEPPEAGWEGGPAGGGEGGRGAAWQRRQARQVAEHQSLILDAGVPRWCPDFVHGAQSAPRALGARRGSSFPTGSAPFPQSGRKAAGPLGGGAATWWPLLRTAGSPRRAGRTSGAIGLARGPPPGRSLARRGAFKDTCHRRSGMSPFP